MDGASAVAATLLDPAPGASVLDLCAAPGGKSLMLASLLFAGRSAAGKALRFESVTSAKVSEFQISYTTAHTWLAPEGGDSSGKLICNEMSRPRLARLQKLGCLEKEAFFFVSMREAMELCQCMFVCQS